MLIICISTGVTEMLSNLTEVVFSHLLRLNGASRIKIPIVEVFKGFNESLLLIQDRT